MNLHLSATFVGNLNFGIEHNHIVSAGCWPADLGEKTHNCPRGVAETSRAAWLLQNHRPFKGNI